MLNQQINTNYGRQLARNDTDFHQGGMKKSESKLDVLYERLKQCQGEDGMVDPARILETMNMVQVEEDPDAYVPEIEKQHQRKEEIRRLEKLYEAELAQKRYDVDKALFDFDESVDNLSLVSDRYQQLYPESQAQIGHNDSGANEEQGKVKREGNQTHM